VRKAHATPQNTAAGLVGWFHNGGALDTTGLSGLIQRTFSPLLIFRSSSCGPTHNQGINAIKMQQIIAPQNSSLRNVWYFFTFLECNYCLYCYCLGELSGPGRLYGPFPNLGNKPFQVQVSSWFMKAIRAPCRPHAVNVVIFVVVECL